MADKGRQGKSPQHLSPASKGEQGVQWDLTSFFPEFDGREMTGFKGRLTKDVAAIQKKAARLGTLSKKTASQWESVILAAEKLGVRFSHFASYIGCLESAELECLTNQSGHGWFGAAPGLRVYLSEKKWQDAGQKVDGQCKRGQSAVFSASYSIHRVSCLFFTNSLTRHPGRKVHGYNQLVKIVVEPASG